MCVLVLLITALRGAGYLEGVVTRSSTTTSWASSCWLHTVFWAYIGFSQYIAHWYAKHPEETIYFLRRNTGAGTHSTSSW
jgi:hypothetical protein